MSDIYLTDRNHFNSLLMNDILGQSLSCSLVVCLISVSLLFLFQEPVQMEVIGDLELQKTELIGQPWVPPCIRAQHDGTGVIYFWNLHWYFLSSWPIFSHWLTFEEWTSLHPRSQRFCWSLMSLCIVQTITLYKDVFFQFYIWSYLSKKTLVFSCAFLLFAVNAFCFYSSISLFWLIQYIMYVAQHWDLCEQELLSCPTQWKTRINNEGNQQYHFWKFRFGTSSWSYMTRKIPLSSLPI